MQIFLARFILIAFVALLSSLPAFSFALAQSASRTLEQSREAASQPNALGLILVPLSDEPKDKYDLPPSVQGLRVVEVIAGHPAAQAGIVAGDVITRFGSVETITSQHLGDSLSDLKRSGQLTIPVSLFSIERKTSRQVTLQLEALPPAAFVSPLSPHDLFGDQITAMFVVVISDFVLENCPKFYVDSAKQTELMQTFKANAASVRSNPHYKERIEMYKKRATETGMELACEEMIRSTYRQAFGPHMIARLINRK